MATLSILRKVWYNLRLQWWYQYYLERYNTTCKTNLWLHSDVFYGMPETPGYHGSRAYYREYNKRLDQAGALVPNPVSVFFRMCRYVWTNPYALINRQPPDRP